MISIFARTAITIVIAVISTPILAQTYLAISGHTMEFDGKGRCVAGC